MTKMATALPAVEAVGIDGLFGTANNPARASLAATTTILVKDIERCADDLVLACNHGADIRCHHGYLRSWHGR